MCGRFTLKTPAKQVANLFAGLPDPDFEQSYNIAPSQNVAAVRNEAGTAKWARLKWGLIPSWSADPKIGYKMINARSETIAEKPSFSAAFKKRRCLIAADGFYEWKTVNKKKMPIYIHLKEQQPFFFAGVWEKNSKTETEIESCTIITTEANPLLSPIHHRMPVILPEEHFEMWLDPEFSERQSLEALLQPYPEEESAYYSVDPKVNKPGCNDPSCVEPIKEQGSLF